MMNSSVYVFGKFCDGYSQYPDDYAQDIFERFKALSKAQSQIAIHRNGNLMYYAYVRELDNAEQYIGFCVLLNGVMFTDIMALFPAFEDAMGALVARGELIYLDEQGNLNTSIKSLTDNQQAVDNAMSFIRNRLHELENILQKLPRVNYAIANDESKTLTVDDDNADIVKAAYRYGYTCILKSKNYDSASMTSYKTT